MALQSISSALLMLAALPGAAIAQGAPRIEQMPHGLEIQFALSALPPGMRDQASVYLLDPKAGYRLAKQGTGGVACLVERTAWEQADYRNDIYVPLCYDAAGSATYLKVIRDAATLRIKGLSPAALKAEIERRYAVNQYRAPAKSGVSYMTGPVMRTWMLPDWKVHTMSMPHLMFYAPNLTDSDVGADPRTRMAYPFVFKEGIAQQTYLIMIVDRDERARIATDERPLLVSLCAYRDILCVEGAKSDD